MGVVCLSDRLAQCEGGLLGLGRQLIKGRRRAEAELAGAGFELGDALLGGVDGLLRPACGVGLRAADTRADDLERALHVGHDGLGVGIDGGAALGKLVHVGRGAGEPLIDLGAHGL